MFGKNKKEAVESLSVKTERMRKKGETLKMGITATTIATVTTLSNQTRVLAGVDISKKIDDVTSGDSSGGMFSKAVDLVVSVGTDAYTLLVVLGMVIGILCTAVAGVSLMATKKSSNRDESKTWILWVVLGLGLVIIAGTVVSIVLSAGSSANSTAGGSETPTQPQ